jgi:very-short-patch-repair endonuclease
MPLELNQKLDLARRDLLDLGLRNTLLNYQHLRSRGAEICEADPAEVFRMLVTEARSLALKPAPPPPAPPPRSGRGEMVAEASVEPVAEEVLPEEAPPAESIAEEAPSPAPRGRAGEGALHTPYQAEPLQTRLLNTWYTARTFIEEQGVNILYLALGLLEWTETDTAETTRKAPLILLPVEISRSDVRSQFRLRHTGEEVGDNLSLRMKLEQDFGIKLPEMRDPADEETPVESYFQTVREAVSSQTRWRVDTSAVVLGFFSFSKLLMYRDLAPESWPGPGEPPKLLRALLSDGFQEPPSAFGDDEYLDARVDPGSLHPVVDADSSQTLVILDVLQGRTLVVQGPPGTGKSQTITNLIAETVAAGRTVLFVAEKMAALEVVKRNLDKIDLGALALELHSHKTNKREVLQELQRTLHLGSPVLPKTDADLATWRATRDRLNGYCDAVNSEIGTSGVRPHDAFGHRLRLDAQLAPLDPPEIQDAGMPEWSAADFRRRAATTAELQQLLAGIGPLREHPFFGSRVTDYRSDVAQLARSASGTLAEARAAGSRLAGTLGLGEPADLVSARQLQRAGETVAEAPNLAGLDLADPGWRRADLPELLQVGTALAKLHTEWDPLLLDSAWTQEMLGARQSLALHGPKWWRILSGEYRQARRQVAGLYKATPPKDWQALLRTADALLEAQGHERKLKASEDLLSRLFRDRWAGLRSPWDELSRIAEFLARVQAELANGQLGPEVLPLLQRPAPPAALQEARDLGAALDRSGQATAAILTAIDLDEVKRCGSEGFAALPFSGQEAAFRAWTDQAPRLQDLVAVNHLLHKMAEDGLASFVTLAESWPAAGSALTDLLHRAWYAALLQRAEKERPELGRFHGGQHGHAVATFRTLDSQTLVDNRSRVARHHWERMPRNGSAGQVGTLRKEFEKKRRHLPIRQLMSQAGHAIQTIKPVFLMSPLSVAAYLPPQDVHFDVVIFDEASQVRPVDAFGALLRANQAVVVGDSQQLPPTTFFDRFTEPGGDEEEVDTGDLESILGLFRAQGAPERTLRWHYRSRHESLIAVSNRLFYEDRLVVFPSPDLGRQSRGLVFHHLPDTYYEPGTNRRRNRGEAQAVAHAVMEHARTRPELTLGVAAFSLSQAQAVLAEVETLRRQDPSCERFFAAHPEEPFFVKNLENVQGDERDVILISVGYGRTQEGTLSLNFGPLNQDGGQRRLNVLISRARQRCEVFANFTADDLDTSRTAASGVAALKTYLQFAARRGTAGSLDGTAKEETPFTERVAAVLREKGWEVHPRIGVAGYFLDLAVVDPEHPGRYLLGIECDGPNYRSARSARDRDRLRHEVLSRLGWHLHRVWSADWFRDPEGELKRLLEGLEQAKAAARPEPSPEAVVLAPPPPAAPPSIPREESPEPAPPGLSAKLGDAVPYQAAELDLPRGGVEIHELPLPRVAGWVHEVVRVESPVHFDEVADRITDALGITRVGSRIRRTLEGAAKLCRSQGLIRIEGDFLWAAEMTVPPVRDRSGLPAGSREIELIAPEELKEAALRVVQSSRGIPAEQLATEVSRLLGFARLTTAMRGPIDAAVQEMVATGMVREQGGFILPRSGSDPAAT